MDITYEDKNGKRKISGRDMDEARKLCPEVRDMLVEARIARMLGRTDQLMRLHDMAIGHQLMCRYFAFGIKDEYSQAIKQVMDEAERMGIPFPYYVDEDGDVILRDPIRKGDR